MIFREAKTTDIPGIQIVRHTGKENILSDPALVIDKDCEKFIGQRGKGWVCEVDGDVFGFSISDLKAHNIWALFLRPEFEGKDGCLSCAGGNLNENYKPLTWH